MADTLTSLLDGVDTAVGRAFTSTATLDIATVSAASARAVTLTLADATSVPGVPFLSSYVPTVGNVVRVLRQGAQMLVIGSVGHAGSKPAKYEAVGPFNLTAQAYTALSTPARVAFVVPPSGMVRVHVKARLTSTATSRVIGSLRVMNGASVVTDYAAPVLEVPAGGGTVALGATHLFTGLTAGQSYDAELTGYCGTAGQTVSIGYIVLVADPVM